MMIILCRKRNDNALILFKPINKILKYLLLQELLPIEVNILTQFPSKISSILSPNQSSLLNHQTQVSYKR